MNQPLPACAFCGAAMELILDFGEVALAGGFLQPQQFALEQKYPLRLAYCGACYAVQVADEVDADVLFRDYFYFSSAIGTLREHFERYAKEVTERFLHPRDATVLEFGCNDGVLLRPLADQGIKTVIGVDPAANVLGTIDDPRLQLVNAFFDEQAAERIIDEHGHADVIMANNVYAHIADIQGTTRAVHRVLKKDGVFVFEVHYLGKVLEEMQYDMIYHEHLYYYSLISAAAHFARYDMTVFDVKPVPIHGGSLRFYVCKNEGRFRSQTSPAVETAPRAAQAPREPCAGSPASRECPTVGDSSGCERERCPSPSAPDSRASNTPSDPTRKPQATAPAMRHLPKG